MFSVKSAGADILIWERRENRDSVKSVEATGFSGSSSVRTITRICLPSHWGEYCSGIVTVPFWRIVLNSIACKVIKTSWY